MDHLPATFGHDRCADQLTAEGMPGHRLGPSDQLDEALRPILGQRPVHMGERKVRHPAAPLGRLVFRQADPCDLRPGEGDPRCGRRIVRPATPLAQGVRHREASLFVGSMREGQQTGDITGRPHTIDVRLELSVDHHVAAVIEGDPELFEPEPGRVRPPTRGHQKGINHRGAISDRHLDAGVGRRNRGHVCTEEHGDSFGLHHPLDRGGCLRFLVWEHAVQPFDERHVASEAGERHRHLGADGTAADHAESGGQLGQLEERLVGEVRHRLEARDRWNGRLRARCDDDVFGRTHDVVDFDRARTDETASTFDDLNAFAAKHVGALGRRNLLDDAVEAFHRFVKRCSTMAVGDQRLRRHASGEGAVAADRAVGDEQRSGAGGDGFPGRSEACRSAADDDQIRGHVEETLWTTDLFRRPVGIMTDASGFVA